MTSKDFVHLHVHSQYSLLHGSIPVDPMIAQVKKFGMDAIALTDHANMFGAVEFYEKAKKEGVKPILGCEVYYLIKGSRLVREGKRMDPNLAHLILLVQNETGYKNLCKLLTLSYLEGFYYKPRLDKEILREYSEGLFALSCCSKGEIPRKIIEGHLEEAKLAAQELAEIFPGRFYLELTDHGQPLEKMVNEALIDFSKSLSLPLVATNNVHYLNRRDREAHEALLCIQTGRTIKEEDRLSYEGEEYYLKSPEEMCELFADCPEAIANTRKIADACSYDFDFKTYYFPKFVLPEGVTSLEDFLCAETQRGLEERWQLISAYWGARAEEMRAQYLERIEIELKCINSMGFAGYFLIVADFINYAKSQQIPVGPGRGSAAGSLVAYCLKITDLDPIPYNLLFERFLNPERISMPDMDIDFCMNRRDEVITYVQQKYGNVSQIITYGKMKAKAVLRDVGRVLDIPYGDVDKIAKLVPNTLNITLEEAVKQEPKFREMENSQPRIKQLMTIARSLEGITRHASTHAAGVVISDRPLSDFLPLYRGSKEEIVTQYDMKYVEKIGLVKFDFLGLKTLTVIDNALKIVKRTRGLELDINLIPLADEKVYQDLSTGDGLGIFQLESSGMRDLLTKLKPSCFEDIVALVALYRPGPLGSGMVDDFINRKHGRTEITYELESLEPILKDTYGVILYQEQVMQISAVMATYSLGEADLLRRAMGKKKPEEMAKQRERFVDGSLENKIALKKAEKMFDLMSKFAEYGFNKSHSAAYALVSYQTAYLKTHYTAEYMASLLTHEMGNTDKILEYINDLKNHQIAVLPPDVNESYRYFSVLSEKEIRFGLAAVKNVGETAIDSIIEVRKKDGKFTSFFNFCERVDLRRVNRKVIESLVKCGAFDNLGIYRSQAMSVIDAAMDHAACKQRDMERGQNSLFERMGAQAMTPAVPKINEWPEAERLKMEREAIGFYITGHPLYDVQDMLSTMDTVDTQTIRESADEAEVTIAGMVSTSKEIMTKKGNRMAFITLEDLKGHVEVVVFADVYKSSAHLLKMDEPLLIKGEVDAAEDTVKLLATQISLLKMQGGSKVLPLRIKVGSEKLSISKLKDFKMILGRYPGNIPVYLHLMGQENKETILKLPKELEMQWNEKVQSELQDLLGNEISFMLESSQPQPEKEFSPQVAAVGH